MIDYQKILTIVHKEISAIAPKGKTADYIPELKKVNPDKFGINLVTLTQENYSVGNVNEKFSLQSIAKVFAFSLAYALRKQKIWERIGVEPSGDPFNSLIQLEQEKGIPRNPLINSGALVVCDILIDELKKPWQELLDFIRKIAENQHIDYNKKVYQSEKKIGYRNAAMVNLMKSFSNINNPVENVLDLYFKLCSVEMSVKELSKSFLFLANGGKLIGSGEKILSKSRTKRTNALMQTCGFYDEAGEFSFKVGLPGKSGVGGGIVALHPGKYAIAVWSPRLNPKGNSYLGMKALELLTTELGWSIF